MKGTIGDNHEFDVDSTVRGLGQVSRPLGSFGTYTRCVEKWWIVDWYLVVDSESRVKVYEHDTIEPKSSHRAMPTNWVQILLVPQKRVWVNV